MANTNKLREQFSHELGVAYGDDPRQIMDVYLPRQVRSDTPVLVFLHGGGFRRGEPGPGGFNGRPYLERGAIFVAMGYRLIPDVRFPDTCGDVELGLQKLRERFKGPLYLSGHSAGAMLAAHVGLRDGATEPGVIRGLVLISGFYDVADHSEEQINRASPRYVANLAEAIRRVPPHTILVAGENDSPSAIPDAAALQQALKSRGASVELFIEPNADHFQANRGFAGEDLVSQAVRQMMRLGSGAWNQDVVRQFRENGGHIVDGPMEGRDLLLLTTRGARSGESRTHPLAFTRDGDRYVVIASKAGSDRNPAWFHNLVAHPRVTLEIGQERFEAQATVPDGAERDRLYDQQASLLPVFNEYQRRTTRRIPVVVLERV
jgi:deazaflavin-dependent oxidoreductase (nitroreductase family)